MNTKARKFVIHIYRNTLHAEVFEGKYRNSLSVPFKTFAKIFPDCSIV